MAATVEVYRLPQLSLPRIRDAELVRTLEGTVLATATSAGLVGTSLVAGRFQAAVATVTAVGHLTVSSTLAGSAVARHVRTEDQPLLVGLLSALATLALLIAATQASASVLAG